MPGNGKGANPFVARPPPPPPPTGEMHSGLYNPLFGHPPPKKGGAGKTRRMKRVSKTRRTRR